MVSIVGARVVRGKGYGYGAVTRTFHEDKHLVTIPAEQVTAVVSKAAVQRDGGLVVTSPDARLDQVITDFIDDGNVHLANDAETHLAVTLSFGGTTIQSSEPNATASYRFAVAESLRDILPEDAVVRGLDTRHSGIHVLDKKVPLADSRRYALTVQAPISTTVLNELYGNAQPGTMFTLEQIAANAALLPAALQKLGEYPEYAQGVIEGLLPAAEGLVFIANRGGANGFLPIDAEELLKFFFQDTPVKRTLVHEESLA